jgi:N6-L-threonylcarbamoyladenine synthase
MRVLGIESSCDETGLAIYDLEHGLLSHALHSQIAMHNAYGGVVPELASRDHIRRVLPLLQTCLDDAGLQLVDIDAIAYTAGPGLAGALLVGASVANGLAFALGKPLIPVHHLEGHLLSPLLGTPRPDFPFVALLVSGGHSQFMLVEGVGRYTLLGETLDDAAGEAFDKTAKMLGLPYPGGPALAALAETGDAQRFSLPRPLCQGLHSKSMDMSFSGLKTAVLTAVQQLKKQAAWDAQAQADMAASFQLAMVEVLLKKSLLALQATGVSRLVVAGGVGANKALRAAFTHASLQAMQGNKKPFQVFYPPMQFCTDNGAMIAFAGAQRLQFAQYEYGYSVRARWDLSELAS